jgi:hypothetical protein
MRLLLPFVCVVLALGLSRPAAALDLYTARAPLADASEAARDNAVASAFGQVLAQVAGRSSAAELAQQPAGHKAAQNALISFTTRTAADGTPLIEANFGRAAVLAFLSSQRVAAPPDRRPTLLLWLLLDGAPPSWVGADEPADLAAAAAQSAAARGLSLLLPVLDLDERAVLPPAIDPTDPASVTALDTAAARYRPDGVLFGRLRGAGDQWQADLRLTLPGRQDAVWSAEGASPPLALDAALDRVGSLLPRSAPGQDGPPAAVQLSIVGIDDMAAYARVWEHLAQVPGLRGLRPVALGKGRAVFGFELAGGEAALAGRVEPGAPFARSADSPDYRYQP